MPDAWFRCQIKLIKCYSELYCYCNHLNVRGTPFVCSPSLISKLGWVLVAVLCEYFLCNCWTKTFCQFCLERTDTRTHFVDGKMLTKSELPFGTMVSNKNTSAKVFSNFGRVTQVSAQADVLSRLDLHCVIIRPDFVPSMIQRADSTL